MGEKLWKALKAILVLAVVGGAFAFGLAVLGLLAAGEAYFDEDEPAIGLIRIEGGIYDAQPVLDQVEKLRKLGRLEAVLVRIDSPGGAIGASQEIYSALREFRADSVPVVVSMGNMGASGGLYASLAGDKVFALPGTITGPIGVISTFPDATELLGKIGVQFNTVKTGDLKDAGSPYRKMNAKDKAAFDKLVGEMFDQFVGDVALERNLSADSVRKLADGSVLSGRQAVAAGLVDTLGTWHDALAYVRELRGLDDEVPVHEALPKKSFAERILDYSTKTFRPLESRLKSTLRWELPGISR